MAGRAKQHFFEAMGWLHTWVGIGLGSILFVVFWTGSLTVFDKEIDQWMKPELRIHAPENVSFDTNILANLSNFKPKQGSEVWLGIPRERTPAVYLYFEDHEGNHHDIPLDPISGEKLDLTDSHAGTGFFFPFHFMLHLPGALGYWLVGIAALAMMMMVVSGVIIHRNIFIDFFTFRPNANRRRSSLDLHNLTAVLGMPFHFLLPFTGILIFATVYFPWPVSVQYDGDLEGFSAAKYGTEHISREALNKPGAPVLAIDDYVARAENIWQAEDGRETSGPDWVGIFNYADANSYVSVERYFPSKRVAIGPDYVAFDPNTDEIIGQFRPLPIHSALNWLEGLHWIQFDHWVLRWLYFFAGLSGCVMIGSGFIFWMQSRIRKGQKEAAKVRVIRAMSIASTTGIIVASGAFFVANRLIPKDINLDAVHRHDLEIFVFFGVWILTLIHAVIRDKLAWREQCHAIAFTALCAVILNWVTTGDHLITSAMQSMWQIALMDITMLATAGLAMWASAQLQKKAEPQKAPKASLVTTETTAEVASGK